MTNPGGAILAINFSTDADPHGNVPEQDQFWNDLLTKHHGCEIGRNQDSVFVEFGDARSAVTCALALQGRLSSDEDAGGRAASKFCRVSVNHRPFGISLSPPGDGEVDDTYKLLAVADLNGISISRTVYDEVRRNLDVEFDTSRPINQCGYLCQNIRQNLNQLDLLQASAVRISPSAITTASANLE